MYSRINYTIVGLFVLLFGAALLGFGFWLAKYGFQQKYTPYVLYFSEPVDGLTLDSTVKLKGVEVGKVRSIEVVPDDVEHIRVLIRLKEGTPITQGMYAVLKLQGITGLSYIQIQGGKRGAPLLTSSEAHPAVIPTHHSLSYQLTHEAPKLLNKLEKAVDNFDKLLSQHNLRQIQNILDNSAVATRKAAELEERVIALTDDFNSTMQRFDHRAELLTREIQGVTQVLDRELPPVMHNINDASQNIAEVAKGIDKRLKRGEYDLRRLVRPLQVDIGELSYRYQELAEDLKALSRNPSSLLFGGGHLPKGPGE
jgi:phospholipid/cholesterol/gamma-HCH transport system substrate-binding protein